ncbi:MAG TPA: amidohydrolase family protein [Beijerinckiaceae bacterium]|nr:amidohydrolase family protein [Beijerinckiaceae bacterium]
MKIDAHQHFWRLDRGDYGWLTPALGPIYRDFAPADFQPLLERHRIDASILVQAAPTVAETEFLLETAGRTPFVAGVVGWIDFDAPDAVGQIDRLAANPLLVGVRPMVQDIADDDWLARASHNRLFEMLVDRRLVFDALVLPRHLGRLLGVVERHPALAIVIDHLAKPPIADGRLDPWRADMNRLAAHANVACKLSGMVTEAGDNWTVERLAPFAAIVLDAFGPQRLLWGSDWPVVDLAGGYERWRSAALQLIRHLPQQGQDAILGATAARVYLGHGRGRQPC